MTYRIEKIELYMRETRPGRVAFALGKQKVQAVEPTSNPLAHVRMILRDSEGNESFGCSGDRLSVRWLDKRPGRSKGQKLRELVDLIYRAAEIHRQSPAFESPFEQWHACHAKIVAAGRQSGQEDLTCAFASALFERALLDGVSRLAGLPLYEMVRQDRLGIRPERIHPSLAGFRLPEVLPPRPRTRFFIRHTIGLADPIRRADLAEEDRVNDGLPETLEEYVANDGPRYFKVKIAGDPARDLKRLGAIWDTLPQDETTGVTLDANEAYTDLAVFERFVRSLQSDLPGLFDHILYIEQPLPRGLTMDPDTRPAIRRIAEIKPLLIDEADGRLDSFRQAWSLGYDGASHKNCKGFFKSLLNLALCRRLASQDRQAFLSGEDLQNLPIAPLHQDFVSLSILGLEHCERNGHHYNYGLSMLSDKEKQSVAEHHRDLYERRGDEWFLRLRSGAVECGSLQCPGYGVRQEPDFASMSPLRAWLDRRYP